MEYDEMNEEINKKETMYDSLAIDYRLAQEEIERLYKELKIKTDFIEELLYLILNSTDNKLQKEVHKIGIKYDKNIQELKRK